MLCLNLCTSIRILPRSTLYILCTFMYSAQKHGPKKKSMELILATLEFTEIHGCQ